MAYVFVDAVQMTQQIDVNFGCFQRNCQATKKIKNIEYLHWFTPALRRVSS